MRRDHSLKSIFSHERDNMRALGSGPLNFTNIQLRILKKQEQTVHKKPTEGQTYKEAKIQTYIQSVRKQMKTDVRKKHS